jgi:hypothetical protein
MSSEARFRERVPTFESFERPGKLEHDELAYKRRILARFEQEGGKARLIKLIGEGRGLDALRWLARIPANLVAFQSWKSLGESDEDAAPMLAALVEAARAPYVDARTLAAVFETADRLELKLAWDALFFVLWLLRPEDYFPVRISYYRELALEIGQPLPEGRPTAESSHTIIQFGRAFWSALNPLHPRSWVDVQSFIWCVCPTSHGDQVRYWAGGFQWGEKRMVDTFVQGNYWQIGWGKDDTEPVAVRCWKLLKEIRPGDEFAVKGIGGKHDLRIYYIGRVISVDLETGRVELEKLDRPLYSEKAPMRPRAGNWREALVPVHRRDIIQQIFRGDCTEANGAVPSQEPSSVDEGRQLPEQDDPATAVPLNLILFGPPGTGKTYRVIDGLIPLFASPAHRESRHTRALETAAECSWWEALALALMDVERASVSELMGNVLVAAKAAFKSRAQLGPLVWSTLQSHTVEDCKHVRYDRRSNPLIFYKDAESRWSLVRDRLAIEAPELARKYQRLTTGGAAGEITKRYEFVTFHQSFGYDEFVEGIRANVNDGAILWNPLVFAGKGQWDRSPTRWAGLKVEARMHL